MVNEGRGDGMVLTQLPVGYRFLPTDEELITSYLRNKVLVRPLPAQVIKEIDANRLYSYPPNTIVNRFSMEDVVSGQREWYFFINYKKQEEGSRNMKRLVFESDQIHHLWTSLVKENSREVGNGRIDGVRTSFGKENEDFGMVGGGAIEDEKEKVNIRLVGDGIGFWRSVRKDPIYDRNGKVFALKTHFVYFSGSVNRGTRTHWSMEEYHLPNNTRKGGQKIEDWALGRITRGKDYTCWF